MAPLEIEKRDFGVRLRSGDKHHLENVEAQWPIGYGVGLRIKRSSVRIRPWPLRWVLGQGSLLPLSQGEAFTLASISYLAILVKYILAKKKKKNLQIAKHRSGMPSFRSLDWFVLCDMQIFSGDVYHPSATSRTISLLFPIVFGINYSYLQCFQKT